METMLFFVLGFGYLILFIWGIMLSKKHGWRDWTNVILLVIIGLIYDNFIIAFGSFIGEGTTLENLSYGRFWLHALFTPTLILFAWSICFKSHLPWTKNMIWKSMAYLPTIGLILYELFTSVRGLELEPNWENGVLTYDSAGQSDAPLMIILITVVLGIVGIIFIVKFRFYWLFFGILIMTSGSILGIWIQADSLMNILEFIFIVSLLLTKRFLVRV